MEFFVLVVESGGSKELASGMIVVIEVTSDVMSQTRVYAICLASSPHLQYCKYNVNPSTPKFKIKYIPSNCWREMYNVVRLVV